MGGCGYGESALTMWEESGRGISTHSAGECMRGISENNMWENGDRICQHSLGRRMRTGDISTYFAE
jgi:hypothetical protein